MIWTVGSATIDDKGTVAGACADARLVKDAAVDIRAGRATYFEGPPPSGGIAAFGNLASLDLYLRSVARWAGLSCECDGEIPALPTDPAYTYEPNRVY